MNRSPSTLTESIPLGSLAFPIAQLNLGPFLFGMHFYLFWGSLFWLFIHDIIPPFCYLVITGKPSQILIRK